MKILQALTVLGLAGIVWAGDIIKTDGYTRYLFETIPTEYSDDSLRIACLDAGANNDYAVGGDKAKHDEYVGAFEEELGTDLVFLCQVSQLSGSPYFYPSQMVYVVDGIQYDFEYDEYIEVSGSSGQLRPDASIQIIFVFKNATRDDEITLYYEDDGISFTPLPPPFN